MYYKRVLIVALLGIILIVACRVAIEAGRTMETFLTMAQM